MRKICGAVICLLFAALAGSTQPTQGRAHSAGSDPSASPNRATTAPHLSENTSPTHAASTTSSVAPEPQTVVRNFYAAINSGNYAEAWRLSLGRFGGSYSSFVAGFRDTDHDELTIAGVSGSAVRVSLLAYQRDGSRKHYTGTYYVSNGYITAGRLRQIQTPTAPPATIDACGTPPNPWGFTFCGGGLITHPPSDFCHYFDCIANFPNGSGYVAQCWDGEFSMSDGRPGACSYHEGERRPLNTP
jgi:hypothetical protein